MSRLNYTLLVFVMTCLVLPMRLLAQDEFVFANAGDTSTSIFNSSIESLMNMTLTTAGKQKEKASEIPASVVIITRDDIRKHAYTSLYDVLENIPGLYNLGRNDFPGNVNFGVRGFSSAGEFNDMMILIDGVNQMEDFANSFNIERFDIAVENIERIEVIRGPMSVVYGSNAFMGVINIITSKESQGNNSRAYYTVGSLGTQKAAVKLEGKEEAFSYSMNLSFRTTDGLDVPYADLVLNADSVLPANQMALDQTTEGHLTTNSRVFNGNVKYKSFYASVLSSYNEHGRFYYIGDDDFDANTNLAWNYVKIGVNHKFSDFYNLNASATTFSNEMTMYSDPRGGGTYGRFDTEQKAVEINIDQYITYNDRFNVGLGFNLRRINEVNRLLDYPVVGRYNIFSELKDDVPIDIYSGFVQVNYSPIKNLKFVGGLRAEYNKDYEVRFVKGSNTDSTTVIEPGKADVGGLQWMPRLAAIYSIKDKHHIKFLYGVSKKRPAYVHYYNVANQSLEVRELATMKTLELNYLGALSKKVHLNYSVFLNDVTDLLLRRIVPTPTGASRVKTENNHATRTIGTELTLKLQPIEKLNVEMASTYQVSRYLTEGYKDVDVYFSPNILAYLKADYVFLDHFSVGVKGHYVGAMKSEVNVTNGSSAGTDPSAYALFDLNLRANDIYKGLNIQFLIANVGGTESRYPVAFGSWTPTNGLVGYGRRFELSIGYEF